MMSVATQLGLGDPESEVLATARSRWPGWVSAHPELGVVEDLLELPAWLRQADRDDADLVLLTLAELSSPAGGDDVAATGVLAWVLLPGVGLLASRMFTLTPRIDQFLAAALWMEARTFPWQRGHRVAANILLNTRKAVMRDLGVGVAADPTWARTFPVAPSERIWEGLQTEPLEASEASETTSAPRTAGAQRAWLAKGNGFRVQPGTERPGDVIFWDSYLGPSRIGHVMLVWDPATRMTIEARSRSLGVGHFSYAAGPSHHIFEIWRVGNMADQPTVTR